ncbi:cytochrome c biogenesis protein CcmG/thiol:disulfide interchange protein DsbE [Caulobacter ginsengisoli]|uniref:Cytochrome c biogenesis protein CcmG/thiol:disulfide interchange protein DsbE n=1 Tax=Caulobacter ginsengisoli TaxID=400775 RepID=A0ABU0ISE0_9CAUL|nr:DsbE family thiol:disulfide interchange protein [Caulobacter ginsengisoli]MDQ0464916.1 cytochrome c biogenesis protein CcmG/thiol:disulfide interchange protein DsbE [Caulobacter ginsengisoli]
MKRFFAFTPLIVLALLAGVFAVYSLHRDPQVRPRALVGHPVPAVTLVPLEGGAPVALGGLKGPVLVNFYASWCVPCRQEAQVLMGLKTEGVTVIGVAYKDEPDASRAFLAEVGNPYAQTLVDRDGRAGLEFGVTGVPETFLIGRDGIIRDKISEPLTVESADRLVRKLSASDR